MQAETQGRTQSEGQSESKYSENLITMKKYPTFWTICSGCGSDIERDRRLRGQTFKCFDCKRKQLSKYKKRYDKHISELLKQHPFKP